LVKKKLKSLVGLRNILVHTYAIVDREIVIEFSKRLRVDALGISHTILRSAEVKSLDPPDTNLDEVVKRLRDMLKSRVALAFLYGGIVKGYKLKGDYDIAIYIEPKYDLYKLGELAVDIAKILNISEEKVDVVCLDLLPPEHILEALNGIPIIVEDNVKLFELKFKTLIQLLDLEESSKITNM